MLFMGYSLIDTHCHLDIIREQGQSIEETLEKSRMAGVDQLVQIGIDLPSSKEAVRISETHSTESLKISYSIGCHPTETHEFPNADQILELAKSRMFDPKFAAIGEIGVDLYHDASTRSQQNDVLRKFLDFSSEYKMPVVIHSRDAYQDTYEALKEFKTKAFGVIHCFTYDYEAAKQFVDLGYYISFSGIVTFKSAVDIQEAAKKIPLESILIETDAPFLSPMPHRGKRNDSSHLPFVLEKMYSLRTEPNTEVAERIYKNSLKFTERKAYHHA
ncbi:TatD family deoxyribonuclease [Leptospira levettii]|nr:TatD family deoxyribonuclease [Leptospira levettii]TGL10308.1 TatD family deoxyribonuclease [Leptospira levettii]TGM76063.1 TatD family deoxyribonuclease [Leptospira levettii]TGM84473.1 TatD family deoxyribonuclease [Leptospira levettii]